MSKTYRVVRTETINYYKDFTTDELLEIGFTPEDLEDAGTVQDVLGGWHDRWHLVDAVCEATEPHGDVQGQQYEVTDVTAHVGR